MKRVLLATALSSLGIATAVLHLRRRAGERSLVVLTYHRTGPPPSIARIDDHVEAASADAFDRQIAFCAKHFDVVGIDDVTAFVRGAPLPRRPLLVTFDDGYRDNFDVAFPILRRHGARAVFFVATSYLEERRLFWWDRIHFVLKGSRREAVELTYPRPMRLPLVTAAARRAAIDRALALVKGEPGLDLARFLEHLGEAAGVDLDGPTERALAAEHLMTWDHVRALRRGGMDVESHTHTHRVLHTMTPDELAADLARSRELLEDVLDERVTALAYPVGRAPAYPAAIRDAVCRAGFELAFSNRAGVNPLDRFDRLDAKRIAVDPSFSDAYFASVLAMPTLAYP